MFPLQASEMKMGLVRIDTKRLGIPKEQFASRYLVAIQYISTVPHIFTWGLWSAAVVTSKDFGEFYFPLFYLWLPLTRTLQIDSAHGSPISRHLLVIKPTAQNLPSLEEV